MQALPASPRKGSTDSAADVVVAAAAASAASASNREKRRIRIQLEVKQQSDRQREMLDEIVVCVSDILVGVDLAPDIAADKLDYRLDVAAAAAAAAAVVVASWMMVE